MKALTCEICGSNDLIKQGGVFVCQVCATKYSVEEARKMMAEANPEESGIVKVDNSEKIEKIAINARRAFSDGKYDRAQELYSQILMEEPDNAEAILYEGLSIGWQGNTVRYTVDKAGEAAKRALEIAYQQKEVPLTFETFVLDTLTGIKNLGNAFINLCYQNIQGAVDDTKSEVERMNSYLNRSGIYADISYAKGIRDDAFSRADSAFAKFGTIIDNTLLIVLSVFEKAIGMLSDIDVYRLDTYDALRICFSAVENETKSTIIIEKTINMKAQLDQYFEEKARRVEAEKRKAIETYWEMHLSEKAALVQERQSLTSEQKKLEEVVTTYDFKISELEKAKKEKVPAEIEIDALRGEIDKLEDGLIDIKYSRLKLLKGKQKKEIDDQIAELEQHISKLKPLAETQRNERNIEYDDKIYDILKQMQPVKRRIADIAKRLSEINEELTKDR